MMLAMLAMLAMAMPARAQEDGLATLGRDERVAVRAASDRDAEMIYRRAHAACVVQTKRSGMDSKAYECVGILAQAFGEARRRGLATMASWAATAITDSIYDPVDVSTPTATIGEAARIVSATSPPLGLPLHAAYAEDLAAQAGSGRGELDRLVTRAEDFARWGRPATEAAYARGASVLARRIEGANSPTARRMDAAGLRAEAMLGTQAAIARCAQSPAPFTGADDIALHARVSCAIAAEQAGRWRDAGDMLRALLPEAQAQASPVARADVLVSLGRNLIRQSLPGEAVPYLDAAQKLLDPLSTGEDVRLIRMPAVRAARVAASLELAKSMVAGTSYYAETRLLGGIYAVESSIASANSWARSAERLQRQIDAGTLRWEGGVWRSLLAAYREAAEKVAQYYGPDAPIIGLLKAKDVEASELFLTQGYREPMEAGPRTERMSADMREALDLVAPIPPTDPHRIETLKVAAGFFLRRGDMRTARGLCRLAVRGAIERMDAAGEYDRTAQAQLKAQSPVFRTCVKTAWLTGAADGAGVRR
ncbi:MAG: hypothetical protein KF783_04900 [Sphingomonas sp.]|nr:hypothetical protein [Sphingomonas sp.]